MLLNCLQDMRSTRALEEANAITAVRLTGKRRFAKPGDLFRLSPYPGVFVWGRLMKRGKFFGHDFETNLVYIYDAIGRERPKPEALTPSNLIMGPTVVNNLGWVRGYWEIMASQPILPGDLREKHLFVAYRGKSPADYELLDEDGGVVAEDATDPKTLGPFGYANFNYIDSVVRCLLQTRGMIPQ